MRLANLEEFRRMVYTEASAPCLNTLRTRIKANEIAGGKRDGRRYYVDLDEFDRAHNLSKQLAERRADLLKSSKLEGLV